MSGRPHLHVPYSSEPSYENDITISGFFYDVNGVKQEITEKALQKINDEASIPVSRSSHYGRGRE